MKIFNEMKLVRIEIILLIFVTLIGAVIQISDYFINNYNDDLLKKQSEINLIENQRISQKLSSLRYLSAAFYNANVNPNFDKTYSDPILGRELKQVVRAYQNNEISKIDYFNQLSVIHNRNSERFYEKYKFAKEEYESMLEEKPLWIIIRATLFTLLFAGIIISLMILVFIYNSMIIKKE